LTRKRQNADKSASAIFQSVTPSLRDIVGDSVYTIWLDMLQKLVPHGRTHRLSKLVAGFMQYAAHLAYEKWEQREPPIGSAAALLLSVWETGDSENVELIVCNFAESLFHDAGVQYQRVNHKGQKYSIAEDAALEFVHWEDMPWE
jgi:hypothetical protein